MSLARIFYTDADGLTKTPYMYGVSSLLALEEQLPVFYRVTNAAITKIRFSPDGYIQENPHVLGRREYIEPTYTDIDYPTDYPARTEPGHTKTEVFAVILMTPSRRLTIPAPRTLLLESPPSDIRQRIHVKPEEGAILVDAYNILYGEELYEFKEGYVIFPRVQKQYGWPGMKNLKYSPRNLRPV